MNPWITLSAAVAGAGLTVLAWFVTLFIVRRTDGSPLGGLIAVGIVVLAFVAIQGAFYLIVLRR